MEGLNSLTESSIREKIYTIRGTQVMLDKDLAFLYQVTTGNLNKAVKRNINKFPPDFMFQLTEDEYNGLIFQNGTPKQRGGNRFLPYAFTEHGLLTLAHVLRSEIAATASIAITRAFVQMRKVLQRISDTNLQIGQLQSEIKQLRIELKDMLISQNDILRDQNNINEDVRKQQDSIVAQLDNINDAIAELQAEKNQKLLNSQRNPIGFNTKT